MPADKETFIATVNEGIPHGRSADRDQYLTEFHARATDPLKASRYSIGEARMLTALMGFNPLEREEVDNV